MLPKEHRAIVNLMTQNPAIVSELSLGKVPESIANELEKKRIYLFPRRHSGSDFAE